ncbi:MAG: helix-turn-helix transcriptional regulator [Gammaproteobacteria bacterium]
MSNPEEMSENLLSPEENRESCVIQELQLKSLEKSKFSHNYQKLAPQERRCILAAAQGRTAQQTAQLLGVKQSTIETYRKSIKQKLNCATLTEAVYLTLCCTCKEV